jgi:hypothetical protein
MVTGAEPVLRAVPGAHGDDRLAGVALAVCDAIHE